MSPRSACTPPTTAPIAAAASVYLETAPRAAFEAGDEPRARMDQRNEHFVPHVLPIVAGTTVDFPTTTAPTTTCSRSRRRKPSTSGATPPGRSSPSGSITRASSASSARSIRT